MNFSPLPPSEAVRSILIWHQGALGDLLLAGPALMAVRRRYPRARLVGLGQPELWRLLGPSLSLDGVWDSGESSWASLFAEVPLSPELQARLARFQLALVFSPSAATPVPGRWRQAGIPAVYWLPSFPEDGQESVAAVQARHLARWGFRPEPEPFRLALPENCCPDKCKGIGGQCPPYISTKSPANDSPGLPAGAAQAKACGYKNSLRNGDRPAEDFLLAPPPGSTGWLAVASGSGQPRKNWPLAHYYEVSRALAWEYKLGVVWLAGPAEAAWLPYLRGLAAAQGTCCWPGAA